MVYGCRKAELLVPTDRCQTGGQDANAGSRRSTMLRGLYLTSALFAMAFGGCASPRLDLSDPGKVSGLLMIFWIREDEFIYYPFHGDPLIYTLPRELKHLAPDGQIRPGAIYTDGGSIPRALRNIAGLSPWGYAPAYIVHDWLFVAHHCIEHERVGEHDARDLEEVEKIREVTFKDSADILAGVVEALVVQKKVPKRAIAPGAIYSAVDSHIARRIWDNPDPKSCDPVTQKDISDIEAKIRAKSFRLVPEPPGADGPVLVHVHRF